ncbi:acid-sensing ion channel 5 [Brachionus plicatilis]|uniref:Acid-sensing ion channel 5 n=1 Tax=Brachionus plicatilis TaxID=10195 RepID=A0A3M7QCV4_BRAPC|nr:acid-sensing ion channel 5 [Brachionus plicatilis]
MLWIIKFSRKYVKLFENIFIKNSHLILEMSNKRQKIIQVLKNAGHSTTSHGLSHILKTKSIFLKFMWILFLFSSCGSCCYLIATSIMNFLKWEVVTKIDIVTEIPSIFPTISICTANPIQNNFSLNFVDQVLKGSGISNNSWFESNGINYQFKFLFSKYLSMSNVYNLSDQERENFGMKINKSIISCYYSTNPCNLSLDFEYHYDNMHSNCIKFNSGKKTELKKASKPGLINGLQMEIYVDEPNENSLSTASGLYLIVHNNSQESHFPEGFTVPVGKQVNIAVQREFISKKARPYSECTQNLDSVNAFDSDLYRTIIQSGKPYRREMCYDLCLQEIIIEKCKCQDMISYSFPNMSYCMSLNHIFCDYEEFSHFYTENIEEKCGRKCPLECDTIKYPVTLTYLDYPTEAYYNKLIKEPIFKNMSGLTYEKLKKKMIFLNIYYSEFQYKKIQEVEKMTIIDLVAGIGGTMGLFIGISFLSLIEIIHVAFEIVFVILENEKNTNKVQTVLVGSK